MLSNNHHLPSSPRSSSQETEENWIQSWINCTSDAPTPPSEPPSRTPSPSIGIAHLDKRRISDLDDDMVGMSSPRKKKQRTDDSTVYTPSFSGSSDHESAAALSTKQSSNPRELLMQLETAQPWIRLSPLDRPWPPGIETRLRTLRHKIDAAVKEKYIPNGLKSIIEKDESFSHALEVDPINVNAYDNDDNRPSTELADVMESIRSIFFKARKCDNTRSDENSWCYGVVWPLMELAIKIHGKGIWDPISVQTQSIDPKYLSAIPAQSAPLKAPRPLFRKTDFCLAYSDDNPKIRELYDRLQPAALSHTTDCTTSRLMLFSGIEVKPPHGDAREAELQLSIWMAANLRKKMRLAKEVKMTHPSTPNALVEPALIAFGHEYRIYYSYISAGKEDVAILGPDTKYTDLTTRTIQGIFKIVATLGVILKDGYCVQPPNNGSQETVGGLWGDFYVKILEKIARSKE